MVKVTILDSNIVRVYYKRYACITLLIQTIGEFILRKVTVFINFNVRAVKMFSRDQLLRNRIYRGHNDRRLLITKPLQYFRALNHRIQVIHFTALVRFFSGRREEIDVKNSEIFKIGSNCSGFLKISCYDEQRFADVTDFPHHEGW